MPLSNDAKVALYDFVCHDHENSVDIDAKLGAIYWTHGLDAIRELRYGPLSGVLNSLERRAISAFIRCESLLIQKKPSNILEDEED